MKIILTFIVYMLMVLSNDLMASSKEGDAVVVESQYEIAKITDVFIGKVPQTADFALYEFKKSDKKFLSLYFGDNPNLGGASAKKVIEVNGFSVSCWRATENGMEIDNYLFDLRSKLRVDDYKYAHFFFRAHQNGNEKLAQQIVMDFRHSSWASNAN